MKLLLNDSPETESLSAARLIVVRFVLWRLRVDQIVEYVAGLKLEPPGPNWTTATTSRPSSKKAPRFLRPTAAFVVVVVVVTVVVVTVVALDVVVALDAPVLVVVVDDVVVDPATVVVVFPVVVVAATVVVVGGAGGLSSSMMVTRSKLKAII
jgi:hypothetical protein